MQLSAPPSPVSLPIYVAESQRYFEREGLAVRVVDCMTGRGCFAQLARGQTDVAATSEMIVVTEGAAATADLAIIATISASARHIKLVARRSAGIAVAEDLRGKKLATVGGSSAQYYLHSLLVYHQIDPKQAQVASLPQNQLVTALQQREIDAIAIWEPVASAVVTALAGDALVLPCPRVYKQHYSLVTSRSLIQQREAVLVKMLRALERSARFIAESPAQARQILKARLPGATGIDDLSAHDYTLQLEQSLVVTMDAQARWIAEQQGQAVSARPLNLLQRIDPTPLRKALPEAVTLVQ